MPSRKITLTNQGFKILSNDLLADLFSILIVGFLLLFEQSWNLDKLFSYLILFLLSSILYIYYNYKIGYLYIASFIYQVLLYLLLTPNIYINLGNIFLTFLFTIPFLLHKNSLQKIYFPLGLYMSLINTCLGLIETHFQILKFTVITLQGEEFQKLPTIFWTTEFLDFGFFHISTFTPLEKSSIFALTGLGVLIFRDYTFLLDLISFIVCIFLVSLLYNLELTFYIEKILAVSIAWVLLVFGPGRNFGFSYSYTFLTLGLTGIFSYSVWNWKASLPNLFFLVLYFLIQTFLFLLDKWLKTQKLSKTRI